MSGENSYNSKQEKSSKQEKVFTTGEIFSQRKNNPEDKRKVLSTEHEKISCCGSKNNNAQHQCSSDLNEFKLSLQTIFIALKLFLENVMYFFRIR